VSKAFEYKIVGWDTNDQFSENLQKKESNEKSLKYIVP